VLFFHVGGLWLLAVPRCSSMIAWCTLAMGQVVQFAGTQQANVWCAIWGMWALVGTRASNSPGGLQPHHFCSLHFVGMWWCWVKHQDSWRHLWVCRGTYIHRRSTVAAVYGDVAQSSSHTLLG
jgi:hypothetical protein